MISAAKAKASQPGPPSTLPSVRARNQIQASPSRNGPEIGSGGILRGFIDVAGRCIVLGERIFIVALAREFPHPSMRMEISRFEVMGRNLVVLDMADRRRANPPEAADDVAGREASVREFAGGHKGCE
jgi:hypothetical protein